MAEALVEHDYKAQELDELTIKKGDIITNISFKPGGWWEGTLKNGKRGMFPDNFVSLIKTEDGVVTTPSSGRRCKVLYPYQPEKEDELELQIGDIIDIVAEVEEGWWKGSLKNRTGVFPSNFVAEITDVNIKSEREAALRKPKLSRDESGKSAKVMNSPSFNSDSQTTTKAENLPDLPTLPPKPAKEYCRVIHRYAASNVDELNLHPGDIITIITKDGQDPGWWKGELKGKAGFFPDNFVEPMSFEEASKTELKTKVSNRLGMAISKSATTSSISDSININSLSRKFSDSSKNSVEEKVPPSVSKKPVLPPPPNKKPSTTSISSAKIIDNSQSGQTSSSGKVMSSSATTIKHGSTILESSTVSTTSATKWSVMESSDTADGMGWSKQSYSVKSEKGGSESSVTGINLNSLEATSDLNLDMVGRSSKKLVHPTASRAKAPKRRPPSGLYTLTKDELKNGGEADDEEDEEEEGLVNGDAEAHREAAEKPANAPPPWVEELKLNQAKKSLQQQQGKTRVMITSTSERSVSGMSTSVTEKTSSVMTTSASERSGLSEKIEKPVVPVSSESKPLLVTLRQQPVTGQRPQSMISTYRPVSSPPSSAGETITVSLKQWNDVLEKVSSLETNFEIQIGALTKAVKELTGMLEEERQKRAVMQQELEKLTDLVTQV